MKIPNAEQAVVDVRKLRDYCLNFEHPTGKHKATLFRDKLGLLIDDADGLQAKLLEIIRTHEAEAYKLDQCGQRYRLDFLMDWKERSATIRSGWIVEIDSDIPRLTSCYPL